MMPLSLQITLFIVSVAFIALVFYNINQRRLTMKYSLLWLLLALAMLVMAVVPEVVLWLAPAVGIETPANFVFLVAMLLLLCICFALTVIVSRQAMKLQELIQALSIKNYLDSQTNKDKKAEESSLEAQKDKSLSTEENQAKKEAADEGK